MIVDFSSLAFKGRPMLILRNLDGSPIQLLSFAHNISLKLQFNETSEITFEVPRYVDGKETPGYSNISGMRIVDLVGIGQFQLANPEKTSSGIKEIKSCTAYSLEYELTQKKLSIEDGTYPLWNADDPSNSVLGIIREKVPYWKIGHVDDSLLTMYRTFSVSDTNVYDFIKSTIQNTFNCIFNFNTYTREINVRSVTSLVSTRPIYISLDNLAKEIKVTENTDDMATCVEVYGADGVDIRDVNPNGTNKIYNLDYFMDKAHCSDEIVGKYKAWKTTCDNSQQNFYDVTVERVLEQARREVEKASLLDLQVTRKSDDTLRSTYIEAIAQGIDKAQDLATITAKIATDDSLISEKTSLIESIEKSISQYQDQLEAIKTSCSFEKFFTEDELLVVRRYIKEDSIANENFVSKTVESYADTDETKSPADCSVSIAGSKIQMVTNAAKRDVYEIYGGTLSATLGGTKSSAPVLRSAFERASDDTFIWTVYLGAGMYGDTNFVNGCISITGKNATISSDCVTDPDIGGTYKTGTSLTFSASGTNLYFTQNTTEYAQKAVEWDLYNYGKEQLAKISSPKYTFSVDSGNFLAIDEFESFKNQLTLGDKIYLNVSDDEVLTPIVIGAEVNLDDPTKLSLSFGDTYTATDAAFRLVDLLEKSVSMGKTVSLNKNSYGAFIESNTNSQIKEMMNSAIDVAKNEVLSSGNQAIKWDDSGITLRKYKDGSKTVFEDCQIKMINRSIVFTRDNWATASMAIGAFKDVNLGEQFGVIAPNIVGTLLASENLRIESAKKDGGVSVFKVDGSGAKLYNSQFDLVSNYTINSESHTGQISLYPSLGLLAGNATAALPLYSYDDKGNISGLMTTNGNSVTSIPQIASGDSPRANFWVDMKGNAYLKGTVYADAGKFTGEVQATSGKFTGTVNAKDLQLNGKSISNIFSAVGTGKIDTDGKEELDHLDIGKMHINSNGDITFDQTLVQVRYSTDKSTWVNTWNSSWSNVEVWAEYSYDGGTTWGSATLIQGKSGKDGANGRDGSDANVPSYIKSTYIDGARIESPIIVGNDVRAIEAFKIVDNENSNNAIAYMGRAHGRDAILNKTDGVALSIGDPGNLDIGGNYVIVTTAGVRMQAGNNSIYVTDNGSIKAQVGGTSVNLMDIGAGTTVTAVWG